MTQLASHAGQESSDEALRCWYLTGPTASGKTRIGIELARRINAEIISLDSMAIYREMNIGTAKPTEQDRAILPHHLVDIIAPDEEFSLAQYIDAAFQCPLLHPAVVSVVPGGQSVDEMASNFEASRAAIPDSLWARLKAEGLLRADAPVGTTA